jgi:hypothetical protein
MIMGYRHANGRSQWPRQGGSRCARWGAGRHVIGILDLVEQDLGVPEVHLLRARCGEIRRRLATMIEA